MLKILYIVLLCCVGQAAFASYTVTSSGDSSTTDSSAPPTKSQQAQTQYNAYTQSHYLYAECPATQPDPHPYVAAPTPYQYYQCCQLSYNNQPTSLTWVAGACTPVGKYTAQVVSKCTPQTPTSSGAPMSASCKYANAQSGPFYSPQ